ncbi:MAG: SulP family inorganic anion transporter, partial [Stackebrandtia sp.]
MRVLPSAARRWLRGFGRPTGADATSGLVTGLFSIPEGMAYASIAGFNPVQGIYAGMAATVFGSLFARTVLMVTTLTSAIALTSQSVLAEAGIKATNPAQLSTLVVLTGLVMILMGVLRLGVVMSFVSNAVMTGFSVGIAVQIITGSLGDATGYEPRGHNKLVQFADWIIHIGVWRSAVVATAAGTIAVWLVVWWFRRLRSLAILVAMLTVTVVVTVAA